MVAYFKLKVEIPNIRTFLSPCAWPRLRSIFKACAAADVFEGDDDGDGVENGKTGDVDSKTESE